MLHPVTWLRRFDHPLTTIIIISVIMCCACDSRWRVSPFTLLPTITPTRVVCVCVCARVRVPLSLLMRELTAAVFTCIFLYIRQHTSTNAVPYLSSTNSVHITVALSLSLSLSLYLYPLFIAIVYDVVTTLSCGGMLKRLKCVVNIELRKCFLSKNRVRLVRTSLSF